MWQPDREAMERTALDGLVLEGMRATLTRARTNPAWVRRLGGARPDRRRCTPRRSGTR